MPPPYQLDAPQCTVHNQCCCWLLLTVHLLLFSILHLLLLQCTDYMKNNPLVKMTDSVSVSWNSEFVRWVATTGIASGQLQCGDRIYLRNRRNGMGVMAFVVDQGGKGGPVGFDLDYNRVFKVLDPDNQDYQRGSMDVDWAKLS
jgi:hypothetical protein